jgi:hypothetical protein
MGRCKRVARGVWEGKSLEKGPFPVTIPLEGWHHIAGCEFFVILFRVHEGTMEFLPAVAEVFRPGKPHGRVVMRGGGGGGGCCRGNCSFKIFVDVVGLPFLCHKWEGFASSHHLDLKDLVLFLFDGHDEFSVKVFGCSQGHIEF